MAAACRESNASRFSHVCAGMCMRFKLLLCTCVLHVYCMCTCVLLSYAS